MCVCASIELAELVSLHVRESQTKGSATRRERTLDAEERGEDVTGAGEEEGLTRDEANIIKGVLDMKINTVHVHDVVKALFHLCTHGEDGATYNLADKSGTGTSVTNHPPHFQMKDLIVLPNLNFFSRNLSSHRSGACEQVPRQHVRHQD